MKQIDRQTALNLEMGLGQVWKLHASQIPDLQVSAPESPLSVSPAETNIDANVLRSVADSAATLESAIPADMSDLSELTMQVANCRGCGLCHARNHTVFGVGDPLATYLFVGEGPGYNENIQGLPFVGPAGHLLDNILRALGVTREQSAYIANVVKCRPTDDRGNDRPPSAEEIAACLPYLQRQIELIQPEIIIALGKTAAVSLLGLDLETPVGQLRGKVHRYRDIPLVVTYHPAYLLRKPVEKSKTWQDLCLASGTLAARRRAKA